MNKNFFFSAMLVIVLVFGITVVGCDNGTTENDTWSDVTSIEQVNGTWKLPSSYKITQQVMEGVTMTATYNNYIVTYNAAAKTMAGSGSVTVSFSGGNINEEWPNLKESFENSPGVTVSNINDSTHSITMTSDNVSLALPDDYFTQQGLQINQNGTKIKNNGMILTKQ